MIIYFFRITSPASHASTFYLPPPACSSSSAPSGGESGVSTGGLLLPGVPPAALVAACIGCGVAGILTSDSRALAEEIAAGVDEVNTIRAGGEPGLGPSSLSGGGLPRPVLVCRLTRLRRCAVRLTPAHSLASMAPARSVADTGTKTPGAQYRCFPRALGQRCPGSSLSAFAAGPGDGLAIRGSYQDEVWVPTAVGSEPWLQTTRGALLGRGAVRRRLASLALAACASTIASAVLRCTSSPSARSRAACSARRCRRRCQRCWVLRYANLAAGSAGSGRLVEPPGA